MLTSPGFTMWLHNGDVTRKISILVHDSYGNDFNFEMFTLKFVVYLMAADKGFALTFVLLYYCNMFTRVLIYVNCKVKI